MTRSAFSAASMLALLLGVVTVASPIGAAPDPGDISKARDEIVAAKSSRCVSVPGASAGDVAVVNITNTQAAGSGWGALRSSGETAVFNRGAAAQFSSVNFAAGTPPNPNLAFSTVGTDAKICYDGARYAHHVILDLAAVIPAANVDATDTTRILDTRNQAAVAAKSSRCVSVPGASAGDVAVVNITNTQAAGSGWGALRSSGETAVFNRGAAAQFSSVNFAAGTPPNPNLAFSTVGTDAKICYDGARYAHHVILDLAAVIPAANVDATDTTRILDTRNQAAVAAKSSRCVSVPGASAGDVAVVNITNTQAAGSGWGALRSSGETAVFNRGAAAQFSSVNFAAGTPPNPNLAFSTVGTDAKICYDGAVSAHHVILDLAAVIPAANVDATDTTRILDTRLEALNNIDRVVSSMQGEHDAYPHGLPSGFDWARNPVVNIGNNPGKYGALIMWGIAYGAADGPEAPYQQFPVNSRVQFRNMRVHILSKLDNTWHVVQTDDGSRANARAYPEDYAGDPAVQVPLDREPSGGSSGKMIPGRNLYFDIGFFTDMASAIGGGFDPRTDIAGVFVTMQARLTVDDPTEPDDSAAAKVLLYTGLDYWVDTTGSYCGYKCSNEEVAIGKAMYLSDEWGAFNMHTMTEAAIRANPPPLD